MSQLGRLCLRPLEKAQATKHTTSGEKQGRRGSKEGAMMKRKKDEAGDSEEKKARRKYGELKLSREM